MTDPDARMALAEKFARWADRIPDALRPAEPDTPRARILAAAARHFADAGFERSTTRAIAESAGVNQAMIHYYFQSKTQLYERVLAGILVELLTSLASSMTPPSGASAEILVHLPERIMDEFASDPVRVAIFRREIGAGAPHLRDVVESLGEAGPQGFRTVMMEYIEVTRSRHFAQLPAESILAFLLVHAYGALLVEPMLHAVFEHDALESMMQSQRALVRRALTGHAQEEDDQ